jgi:hypothetical protein
MGNPLWMLAIETFTTGQKPIATKLPYKPTIGRVQQTVGTKTKTNTTSHQATRRLTQHRHSKDTRKATDHSFDQIKHLIRSHQRKARSFMLLENCSWYFAYWKSYVGYWPNSEAFRSYNCYIGQSLGGELKLQARKEKCNRKYHIRIGGWCDLVVISIMVRYFNISPVESKPVRDFVLSCYVLLSG